MSYEIEADYSERWLLPPSLEDLLPAGHPARLVREFVDAVDLVKLGFKTRKNESGRPNYSGALLMKVFLYGYMNRTRSFRGLERACLNDMGMLWLTGMNYPDHTSLWRFWNDNRSAIRGLFRQLLQIAASANLVGLILHAVDGTKILSQASDAAGWHRSNLKEKLKKLDEAIDQIMKETEQSAGDTGGGCQLPEKLQDRQQLRETIQKQLAHLNQKDRDHLQPKDEDARVMKCGVQNRFAYNAQAVVDEKSKLIVAADVVSDESDNYQLVPMLEQVQENLDQAAEQTVADAGYFATTQLAEAEDKHFAVVINLPESVQGSENEPYHVSRFVYDEKKDHCLCPRGEVLAFEVTVLRDKAQPYEARRYRCQSYETCPVRWQCSASQSGRTVQIHPNHAALLRQREKLKDAAMRAQLKKRSETVEPIFGWAKEVMGFRRWSFRGRDKVRTQWSLQCTAMNLRRLYKSWQEGKLAFV